MIERDIPSIQSLLRRRKHPDPIQTSICWLSVPGEHPRMLFHLCRIFSIRMVNDLSRTTSIRLRLGVNTNVEVSRRPRPVQRRISPSLIEILVPRERTRHRRSPFDRNHRTLSRATNARIHPRRSISSVRTRTLRNGRNRKCRIIGPSSGNQSRNSSPSM